VVDGTVIENPSPSSHACDQYKARTELESDNLG
jgi:hypothetical protein